MLHRSLAQNVGGLAAAGIAGEAWRKMPHEHRRSSGGCGTVTRRTFPKLTDWGCCAFKVKCWRMSRLGDTRNSCFRTNTLLPRTASSAHSRRRVCSSPTDPHRSTLAKIGRASRPQGSRRSCQCRQRDVPIWRTRCGSANSTSQRADRNPVTHCPEFPMNRERRPIFHRAACLLAANRRPVAREAAHLANRS